MNDFYAIFRSIPKLSFKEYDECLETGDNDSKNKFILAFMPYLLQITYGVYHYYQESFNAYYSYEDFVSDGVIVATSLFYSQSFSQRKANNGKNFREFFRAFQISMIDKVSNALSLTLSRSTGYRMVIARRKAFEFKEKNGRFPTLDELVTLTNYKKKSIREMVLVDYIDDSFYYEETDDIIDELIKDGIVDELNKELSRLKPILSEAICRLNCYPKGEKISETDLGKELGVSQQVINYRRDKGYQKIKKHAPHLRDYYAK